MSLVSYRYISDDPFSCQSSQWLLSVREQAAQLGASLGLHLSGWQVGCYPLEQGCEILQRRCWVRTLSSQQFQWNLEEFSVSETRLTLTSTRQQAEELWGAEQGLWTDMTGDASTPQRTRILLYFKAAYAPQNINAKASDMIKIAGLSWDCLVAFLVRVYLERWTHICCLRKNMFLETASSARYV